VLTAWQHARRKRRGSGRAASYKLANQASSAGVWRRESAKRRTRTSLIPCLLRALSLARRPGRLPCLLRLCNPWLQPHAPLPVPMCLCYVCTSESTEPTSRLLALGPTLVALAARPKRKKPQPQPPTEGVFSFQYNSQCNSQYNSHTGQKSAIPEFRTSWGGLISRLLCKTLYLPRLADKQASTRLARRLQAQPSTFSPRRSIEEFDTKSARRRSTTRVEGYQTVKKGGLENTPSRLQRKRRLTARWV
jgi:hypothetical protein